MSGKINILLIVALSSFFGSFLTSSINIALPKIENSFSLNAIQLSWIVTAFLLSTAMLLLPVGKIGDILGIKKIFKIGIIIFAISSVLCAISNNGLILIFSRFLQGIGAAFTSTTGPAILVKEFPQNHRGRVLGISTAAVYIGLAAGPVLGGFLTFYLGWRSIFYLASMIGIIVFFISIKILKNEDSTEIVNNQFKAKYFRNTILYLSGLPMMFYGSSVIPNITGWILIITGTTFLIIFLIIEYYSPYPVFNTKLFINNKLYSYSNLSALINYSSTFAIVFLMSLYLQKIKGLTARDAGMILVSQPIVMALFSPISGRLSDKIQTRCLASIGMLFCAIGLVGFAFVNESSSLGLIVFLLVWEGFGFALFSSPNMNTIMSSVDKNFYGQASGTAATMRLLGQILSMTTVTFIYSLLFGKISVDSVSNDLFMKSIKIIFIIFSLLSLSGIYFSYYRGKQK